MSAAGTRVALTPGVPRRAVRRAIEYIHANLAEDVCLADIARAAGLSTFHFARVFRRLTGMTPKAFRNTSIVRIAYGSPDLTHPLRSEPPQ